jgi:hypothetical protein
MEVDAKLLKAVNDNIETLLGNTFHKSLAVITAKLGDEHPEVIRLRNNVDKITLEALSKLSLEDVKKCKYEPPKFTTKGEIIDFYGKCIDVKTFLYIVQNSWDLNIQQFVDAMLSIGSFKFKGVMLDVCKNTNLKFTGDELTALFKMCPEISKNIVTLKRITYESDDALALREITFI